MKSINDIKNILKYLLSPEDTTEKDDENLYLTRNPALVQRNIWMGLLKALFWAIVAIALPLLLSALAVLNLHT